MSHKIITITREYGSGGRLIAKKVAEALNISFYESPFNEAIIAVN